MNKADRIKYDEYFDKVDPYKGLEKDTLTIRLEGNICERCPSDMHRYDISFPAEVGSNSVDFTCYAPKHKYELIIKSVNENSIGITFNGNDYTLHEGINFLFDIRESQASYDGPWFTGVDELKAVWVK